MKLNLALISAIPNYSHQLTQVRIHWLLNLIEINSVDSNEKLNLNWSYFDEFTDLMFEHQIRIGFELMGNPSNYFADFNYNQQIQLWNQLIKSVVERLINNYGANYVQKINFETWNEPDHNQFETINFTINSFLNYYRSSKEAIDSFKMALKFGGPAEKCLPINESDYCWTLMKEMVKSGATDDQFLSFHEKGENFDSNQIMIKETQVLDHLQQFKLNQINFVNNEADLMKIWSQNYDFRADVRYAASAISVLIQHIDHFVRNRVNPVKLKLISFDNGFLSYYPHQFTQRTLLARFQINNTIPNYTDFVIKPIYVGIGLSSLLGTQLVNHDIDSNDDHLKIVATRTKDGDVVVLISNSNRFVNETFTDVKKIQLLANLTGLNLTTISEFRFAIYKIDNERNNPYKFWTKHGRSKFPAMDMIEKMNSIAMPTVIGPKMINETNLICDENGCQLRILEKLRYQGISLVAIARKVEECPKMVKNLRAIKFNKKKLLMTWKNSNSRFVRTYEIEYSPFLNGSFSKINHNNVIFPFYFHRGKF